MGRNMRIAAFPIIVGFLTGFGLYLMKIPDLVMPRLEFLLNAIISCATTVSGFIISSVASNGVQGATSGIKKQVV